MRLTLRRAVLPSPTTCQRPPPRLCYEVGAVDAADLEADDERRDARIAEIVDDARSVGAELLVTHGGAPLALITPDGAVTLPLDQEEAARRATWDTDEARAAVADEPRADGLTSAERARAEELTEVYRAAESIDLLSQTEAAYFADAAYHRDQARHEHEPGHEEREARELIRERAKGRHGGAVERILEHLSDFEAQAERRTEPLSRGDVRAFEQLFRSAGAAGLLPRPDVSAYTAAARAGRRADLAEGIERIGRAARAAGRSTAEGWEDTLRSAEQAIGPR